MPTRRRYYTAATVLPCTWTPHIHAVVLTEGLKLALCTGAVLASAHSRRQHLGTALASTLRNGLPMAVPACCFVMQQVVGRGFRQDGAGNHDPWK